MGGTLIKIFLPGEIITKMKNMLVTTLKNVNQSFSGRVFLRLTALISIITICFIAFFIFEEGQTLKKGIRNEGELFAQLIANNVRLGVFSENTTFIETALQAYVDNRNILSVTVFNSEGKVLIRKNKLNNVQREGLEQNENLLEPIFTALRENPLQYYYSDTLTTFEVWTPVVSGLSYAKEESVFFTEVSPDVERTLGYVRLVLDKSMLNRQLYLLFMKGISLGLVFLFCGPAIFYIMVKKVTRPLNKLTENVRALGKGSAVESLPIETDDEIGKLALAFNEMTDSLKKQDMEKQQLEGKLMQAQKMEAIGTLAGGIAHDFNNILNVIIGYGTMVMDRIGDDQLSREHMKELIAAADRAANLTRRLLLFSRKEVAEVKPMDVNGMLLNMKKMLSRIIGEDINLVTDLIGTKALVMADAGQIEQVLMNLATNARDAMPGGGRLTFKTELSEIDTEFINAYGYGTPGAYAVISITDTGTGIDKEKQTRIFDPFFTTKEVGKGTGLGLAIAYGIMKQHNGYIQVYSDPGNGTTFKIWLPVIEDTAEEKHEVKALSPQEGGTETILVAEDDVSLRKLTRTVLQALGYNVITAEDGEDAITKFMDNKDKIALVVLDMLMPKKSGKEVSEVIRKDSPMTKILFVSGYTMDTIKTTEISESGFDLLHKPVLPKELLRKVREVLDR